MWRVFFFSFLIVAFSKAQLVEESVDYYMAEGDSAYANFENEEALENYLKVIELDADNYDAHWKASRAYLDIGEILTGEKRPEYYKKGEEHARRAIEIQPEGSMGHLFLSVALGRVALDASAKERIRMSKEIKKEVDLAIQYDPRNDIAYHVLGRWHRKIANLSWIEKGFANMFLGGVPEEASNERAVENFKKAIELNPMHINHHLELGITYMSMGNDNEAIIAFKKVLDLPQSDADDLKYKAEASEYLEDLQ